MVQKAKALAITRMGRCLRKSHPRDTVSPPFEGRAGAPVRKLLIGAGLLFVLSACGSDSDTSGSGQRLLRVGDIVFDIPVSANPYAYEAEGTVESVDGPVDIVGSVRIDLNYFRPTHVPGGAALFIKSAPAAPNIDFWCRSRLSSDGNNTPQILRTEGDFLVYDEEGVPGLLYVYKPSGSFFDLPIALWVKPEPLTNVEGENVGRHIRIGRALSDHTTVTLIYFEYDFPFSETKGLLDEIQYSLRKWIVEGGDKLPAKCPVQK